MNDPRRQVIDTALAMNAQGINRGSAGNVSLRFEEAGHCGFLITPTGMAYADLTPADIVHVAMNGTSFGRRQPSSEWRLHRDLYAARPEAGAVLHAHSPFATALACQRREIPPFHYMIARFGGETIRCADYATFGTQALSDAMMAALAGRSACLLANHGMVLYAADLAAALDRAIEFEALCEQYWRSCQLGQPVLLDAAEMADVRVAFRDYGRQK
jgi:L-fuculose-phosphate aldolase